MVDIIEIVSRAKPVQKYNIRKNLDIEYDRLINKTEQLGGRFLKYFYSQVVNCAKADVYEFYIEILNDKGIYDKVNFSVSKDSLSCMLKWISFYHVVRFIDKKGRQLDGEEIEFVLFDLFQFDDEEKEIFTYFSGLNAESRAVFEVEFAKFMIDRVMKFDSDTIVLAFVNNFFYNSFEGFVKSFTNYVSLNSKIYKMYGSY